MGSNIFWLLSAVVSRNPAESEVCSTWLIIIIIVIVIDSVYQQSQNENKTNDTHSSRYSNSKTSINFSSQSKSNFYRNSEKISSPFDEEIDEILSRRDENLWQEKYRNNIAKQSQLNHGNSYRIPQKTLSLPITTTPIKDLANNIQDQPTESEIRKNDWRSFEFIIRNNHIDYLYHFTDANNLASIVEHGGLYSWRSCFDKGIRIACPGGNLLSRQLDSHKNLDDYIHLAFNKEQPMLYVAKNEGRIHKAFILRIDPSVIYWKLTLFSDRNAASNQARIGGEINDFCCINFAIACGSTWSSYDEKSAFQAEVLVHSHIPIKYIYF